MGDNLLGIVSPHSFDQDPVESNYTQDLHNISNGSGQADQFTAGSYWSGKTLIQRSFAFVILVCQLS